MRSLSYMADRLARHLELHEQIEAILDIVESTWNDLKCVDHRFDKSSENWRRIMAYRCSPRF
jgi:hypothetical protein